MIQIAFDAARPAGAYSLAIPLAPGEAIAARLPDGIAAAAPLLEAAAAAARFGGEAGSLVEAHVADGAETRRLLLGGIGAGADGAKLGSALVGRLLTSGETRLVVDLSAVALESRPALAAAIAEAAVLRGWRYDLYRTKLTEQQKPSLAEIVLVVGEAVAAAEAAWRPRRAVTEGVALTRALVTEPANILYPESFVERCLPLADLGLEIEVLDEDEMRALGMGALLGVAQGSARPARLLAMTWRGAGADAPLTAFVGKGVTFDTGGISLKPPAGMEDMKWDMGGAGAVAGLMQVLATRKARANVIGVCGLVENMPDANAQRPGDVVVSLSGQTIEVINTDAEGRLVLCDALTWVQRTHKPATIVDLATLTGAMIVSLGKEYGGIFANDDALAEALIDAGRAAGEKLWRMPMGDAYDKMLESGIADMKNVGPREAGSITAAQFLARYIEDGVAWAHLDIAGMVWAAKAATFHDKGATGYGVRLLDRYVTDRLENAGDHDRPR